MVADGTSDEPILGNQLEPDRWSDCYSVYLHEYARRKINDEDLVKDLVQDTFLTAIEQIPTFSNRSSEKTWLTGILKIKIFLVYRKKANERVVLSDSLKNVAIKEHEDNSAEEYKRSSVVYADEQFDKEEFMAVLCKGVKKIPGVWREVFILKYIEEQKAAEICHALNLSDTQYWMICHRLRVNLKAYLVKTGFEGWSI
ncbi:sigma-70 family RNA polymerase sigma factor [Mucilaginibacter sp. cycad4]|uniref:RNA polymerase sigma factor n=1 Tax=Mucilaginibacter sp. cycad4 TaxID=3342096 RepID=UPI002AAC44B2|nr:sigma-70 family RNA polymerase sigma factor [Mucilaginibacter gossypii]WPU99057.1 sigma-70 family RNA polymerase sigma factor [Mucilaginibacter gossypii]